MGMDFCALLRYQVFSGETLAKVDWLERHSIEECRHVLTKWRESRFADISIREPVWTEGPGSTKAASRPDLPCLKASLRTTEGFFLTFGIDAVYVYHPLRWSLFLVDTEWQEVMLNACRAWGREFRSVDGIVTSDYSPVIGAFLEGQAFEEALKRGKGAEGEVVNVRDLYREDEDGTWESHGFWRFIRGKNGKNGDALRI